MRTICIVSAIRSHTRLTIEFVVVALLAAQVWFIGPALAQDEKPQDERPQIEEGGEIDAKDKKAKDEPGDPTEKTDAVSVSAQVLSLEQAIKADRAALLELEKQIKTRQQRFRSLSEHAEKVTQRIEKKTKRLEELGVESDGEEAKRLRADIQRLQGDISLIKSQSDLEVQAERTERRQVQTLADKIKKNEAALQQLRGTGQPVVQKPVADTPDRTPQPSSEASPSALPPGLGVPVGGPTPPSQQNRPVVEIRETAEQIEARKEAEKKEQEAKAAERAVVDYVERKNVLEEQIAQESALLKTAEHSHENFDNYLQAREAELKEKIASGAKRSELKRIQDEITLVQNAIRRNRADIRRRTELLSDLNKQLKDLQSAQLKVVNQATEKRQQAEEARKKSIWLESPLHPQNLLRWITTRGPRILLVVLVIGVLLLISRLTFNRIARVMIRKGRGEEESRINRAETLALSFRSVTQMIILVGGMFLILEEAGIDIKTVLGGAAIIGLAVAFGAQNLMRDYFTGFMILIEDQYELGDVVSIGDATGVVEKVNMRTTVLRDLEGRVHFLPNGQIRQVTNRTYEWARAVFDIGVAYKEDVDRVMALLVELANEMRVDPEYKNDILEEPLMLGVDNFGNAAVTIKFMLKTKSDKMWPVKRELLRRIKNRFDAEGIRIPVPHRIVFQNNENPLR